MAEEKPRAFLAKVSGIAGPLCELDVDSTWTVDRVKRAISGKLKIPMVEMVLLLGTHHPLEQDMLLAAAQEGGLLNDAADSLPVTVLRLKGVPSSTALWSSLRRGDTQEVLELLKAPRLPGLNDRCPRTGGSALHEALSQGLTVVARVPLSKSPKPFDRSRISDKELSEHELLYLRKKHWWWSIAVAKGAFVQQDETCSLQERFFFSSGNVQFLGTNAVWDQQDAHSSGLLLDTTQR